MSPGKSSFMASDPMVMIKDSMEAFFEFEKPIVTLEKKLEDLKELSTQEGMNLKGEIVALEKKLETLIDETYAKLSAWQKVQLSRHPNRPYVRDYVDHLFPDFLELHGDRLYGDDQAMLGGFATWNYTINKKEHSTSVLILGQQKGRSTKERMERNFGMVKPEGYRKAMRLMEVAERMRLPVVTFIDTPGAYPGIEAEERGQSQAIAESIRLMFGLTVPVVSIVIGEGGSGGALAIGVANKVLMQEYSTYSVISPESCASILWNDSLLAEKASHKLKMSPADLLRLEVIDEIIKEPKGGAHRNWEEAFSHLKEGLEKALNPMLKTFYSSDSDTPAKTTTTKKSTKSQKLDLKEERIEKFRKMGQIAFTKAKTAGP